MGGGPRRPDPVETVLGLILLTSADLPPGPGGRLRLLAVPVAPAPGPVLTVVVRASTRCSGLHLRPGLQVRAWGRLRGRTLEARRLQACHPADRRASTSPLCNPKETGR
ncbi:MAG: hypothetical protein OWV35_07205 [Firmicutes bacterium]|nr:hypothetical protein [Bacillota bacterium]